MSKSLGLLIIFIMTGFAAIDAGTEVEVETEFDFTKDFKQSLGYMGHASYLQFTDAPSIFLGATGLVALGATYRQRHKIENSLQAQDLSKEQRLISDLNIAFSLPLISLGSWFYAKKTNNQKHRMFAKEYFATLYLTQGETLLLSFVPVNKRPSSTDLNVFEKNFRGNSSFPSGHMIPASTLFWKTFQYYGLLPAAVPAAWCVVTGYQRVHSRRHHITDVVGTFFLSGMASEGVRIAAGHKNNHPLYKWMFEHRFSFNFFKGRDALQTTIDFTF